MESKFDYEGVKKATYDLLKAIGEDPEREGLVETPRRVAGYWKELTEGINYTNEEIAKMFKKDFEVRYNPIVTERVFDVFSHCEHHLALMYSGDAVIGYIPNPIDPDDLSKGYRVLGLSKINRIVDLCSKRLQLQEKLAADIAECIQLASGSNQVYVNLTLSHGCVSARGPKSRSFTTVTFMTDALKENKDAREEFERKAAEMISRGGNN